MPMAVRVAEHVLPTDVPRVTADSMADLAMPMAVPTGENATPTVAQIREPVVLTDVRPRQSIRPQVDTALAMPMAALPMASAVLMAAPDGKPLCLNVLGGPLLAV